MLTTTVLALVVRLLIAVGTRTVFQPDEYFQSLEPAHHIVFGYGYLTWEWLNPRPIRSILYPVLNVPIYWFLKATGLDSHGKLGDLLIIIGPRLLHGSIAAATDVWLCELTRQTVGPRYVSTAIFLSLTSFFHALALSRSLSNSLETSLTTIALSFYPWDSSLRHDRWKLRKMLIFAALACSVRATNALIWLFLISNLVWRSRTDARALYAVVADICAVGISAAASLLILDTFYYGKLTFTPFSFLVTNLSGVSLFYGASPGHYYLSQALPILCTTSLPFVLDGIWMASKTSDSPAMKTMLGVVVWTIGAYSLAGHKEWRFIHPLLPLLHIFAAKSLVDRSTLAGKEKEALRRSVLPIRRRYMLFLVLTVPASIYVVLFYCSAPISLMSYIRGLPTPELQGGSMGILMPCHSTPGHAYLHRPKLAHGALWALGCEPPLEGQDLETYRDQTSLFFQNPYKYLKERFPAQVDPSFPISPYPASIPGTLSDTPSPDYPWVHEWPRHLAFFGALLEEDGVRDLLEEKGYQEVWKRGRYWEGDGDERKGGVRVWKWNSSQKLVP